MVKMTFNRETGEAEMEKPIGAFHISAPHLAEAKIYEENGDRIFEGRYLSGASFKFTTKPDGAVSMTVKDGSTQMTDSSDGKTVTVVVKP